MHVAIICDGNRRWAKEHGLSTQEGYEKGIETVRITIEEAIKQGVQHLTLFVLSTENANRTPTWLSLFKKLIWSYLKSMSLEAIEAGCKIAFIGNKDILGHDIGEVIQEIETRNPQEIKLHLNFCFGYSGRQDIMQAVDQMIANNAKSEDLQKYLWTKNMPDPDLIIRTSGEYRLSNFLLFEGAYSELFFIKEHWPDFSPARLSQILEEFHQRERRFGQ